MYQLIIQNQIMKNLVCYQGCILFYNFAIKKGSTIIKSAIFVYVGAHFLLV